MVTTLKAKKSSKTQPVWLCIAALLFIVSYICPNPSGLEAQGTKILFLLVISLIFMFTEALPGGMIGLLMFVLQPVMGIQPLSGALYPFTMTSCWFLFVSFSLSAVIGQTSIPTRILVFMLKVFGTKSKSLILGIMAGTAFISMFISNLPATAIPMGFALILIKAMPEGESKQRMAKALMIGIPFAAMMGGCGTPAGSTTNVIAMNLAEIYTSVTINFGQWMCVGVPVAIIGTLLCWLVVVFVYKPPEIDKEIVDDFMNQAADQGPMTWADKLLLMVFGLMFVLWVLGTWVKALDTTVVAILGLCLLAMPKYGVTSMDTIFKNTPWSAWLMGQGIGAAALVVNTSGTIAWLMENYVPALPSGTGVVLFLLVVGLVLAALHIPIPIGPSLIGLTIGPLLIMAEQLGGGLNPMYIVMALTFFCAFNMVLPLDSVPILTYGQGYYTFGDYFKGGIPATILMTIVVAVWIPIILPILNFV